MKLWTRPECLIQSISRIFILQTFHAELHQYKHQIELFNSLTQKLIAVYQQDDTTRVKKLTETINQRYNNLNTRWVIISIYGKLDAFFFLILEYIESVLISIVDDATGCINISCHLTHSEWLIIKTVLAEVISLDFRCFIQTLIIDRPQSWGNIVE